ncbi:Volvatoxin A2 in monoclinic crystal [Collybia nuda]|uniref:Volvatoxin A2 in monoclinic crystal n=1 Tax=Collybia nuda TaxID=64659 RepID=A0A9P6CNR0_9AGAR|nr:Volvatoxin A2 in monoclinic crystal [Collybia nuda]
MSKLEVRVLSAKGSESSSFVSPTVSYIRIMIEAGDVFQPVDGLPEDLVLTSLQVMKFSGGYLTVGDEPNFDWPGFKNAVDHYPKDDLTLDKYNQSTINQQTQDVDSMVNKVATFLHDAFSAAVELDQLRAIILNTFTNLRESSDSGFLQFSSSSEKHNSSWEYRVLFSVPFGQNAPSYFYSLVTTIKITADIVEESSWWGLSSSTKQNFGAQIDGMELVVKKGFKAPLWSVSSGLVLSF